MRRALPIRLLVIAACAAAAVLSAAPAAAHAYLVRSDPGHNARIAQAPKSLRMQFSEPVEPSFVEIVVKVNAEVVAPAGAPVVEDQGRTLRLALPAGAAGDYEVAWRIVARDGHPTQGTLRFTVAPRR